MSFKLPLVSIIIPTYNRAHLIAETLNSILNQSYKNWECLIIDDGSTDNTEFVVAQFLKDDRFKYYHRTSGYLKGPSGSRNYGIDIAKGEKIIFFDSDDIVHPDNLKICVDVLNRNPELSYCRYEKQPFTGEWNSAEFDSKEDLDLTILNIKDIDEIVTNDLPFACCTVMWRHNALGTMRFDEKLCYAEEWEYYIRILAGGIEGASLSTALYYNRKHARSNTGEFWAYNEIRRESNIAAVLQTLQTLSQNKLLNDHLSKHFIRLGFFLNSIEVLSKALFYSDKGAIYRYKYLMGFYIYPVLRPFFRLKGKLTNT